MIKSPPQKYNPKQVEEKILKFWEENNIFQKSIDQRKNCKPYIFLEGPPTANGMPHPGHVLNKSYERFNFTISNNEWSLYPKKSRLGYPWFTC